MRTEDTVVLGEDYLQKSRRHPADGPDPSSEEETPAVPDGIYDGAPRPRKEQP